MAGELAPSWQAVLADEFDMPYMRKLKAFLLTEKQNGKVIYPKGSDIFNAFNSTPFDQVKVVILGQDPYHGPNQAHGLSFSVQKGVDIPPSLRNIYKELAAEFPDFEVPKHGNLSDWAEQGVLLLNATLTVAAQEAGSHQKKGWEIFTDKVIKVLSEKRDGIIFILWGKFAQQKENLIDTNRHYILKSAHPSPLSAYNGFFGCNHFLQTNQLLTANKRSPINWQIAP